MNPVKAYSGRALFWVVFFMAILCALAAGAIHVALDAAGQWIAQAQIGATLETDEHLLALSDLVETIRRFFLPVVIGIFLTAALLLWLCLRLSLARLLRREDVPATGKRRSESAPAEIPAPPPGPRRSDDRRLFLHLFSSLQRKGRLMDFLSQDLTDFDDEQIGAAVRTIHENCAKTLGRYVDAGPILEAEEESRIVVEPGFDPNAIRLSGNVVGEPPFTGIVRHRGWRARKVELPDLAGEPDPAIIAPAEVEIP
jgi:hypothetical protein